MNGITIAAGFIDATRYLLARLLNCSPVQIRFVERVNKELAAVVRLRRKTWPDVRSA